jgi:L,D-transpeptidase ErfK/SrfK
MSILRIFLGCLVVLSGCCLFAGPAPAAGPFYYRLPQGSGFDPAAVTVVGEPRSHHLVRYENMYDVARKYDLGFWELARYHRQLDHFYLPWDSDIAIPTQWILPEDPNPPGYLINVAELRGYRYFPGKSEVRTFPLGLGVLDYKTPIGKKFRVQSRVANPGWRIPPGLRWKYDGRSFLPPGPDNPVGDHWLGLSKYGLYEPVKFGYLRGRIFVEVHEDIYFKIPNMFNYALQKLEAKGLAHRINWTKFIRAAEERTGAPVDITR